MGCSTNAIVIDSFIRSLRHPNPEVPLWDPGFIKFQQELEFCPLDWRTTIHQHIVPSIFHFNHVCQVCWKNVGSTFQCVVVLQSRGQSPKKRENYGIYLSLNFNKNQHLVPGIGGHRCIKILVRYFSNHPDICGYVRKLQEQHFNVRMFCKPGDKILILDEILWSQELRVQLKKNCDKKNFT